MSSPNLPLEIIYLVLRRLESPKDLSNCSQVNRLWYQAAIDSKLWLKLCQLYFVPIPIDHNNYKEKERERFIKWNAQSLDLQKQSLKAFKIWYKQFTGFHLIYPKVKELACRLHGWLRANSPLTFMTLQPGVLDWENYLQKIKVKLQLDLSEFTRDDGNTDGLKALFLFYHFIDGQKPRVPHVDAGLFGTFVLYGQLTSLFMLPSSYVQIELIHDIKVLVFAVCPRSGKFLGLVLKCGGSNQILYHVVEISDKKGEYVSRGPFLDFLRNYVDGLEAKDYDLTEPDKSLSYFSNSGPHTSVAVTRGIEIHCSSIPLMEGGGLVGSWVYRIKLRYLGGLDAPKKCQLIRRHWIVKYKSGSEEHVNGDGVVGQYPTLSFETPEFSYCSSCASRSLSDLNNPTDTIDIDSALSMEGEFEFIPGTIINPTGEPFLVRVAKFNLIQPVSIFGDNRKVQKFPTFDWTF